jgi:hypothetical protein
MKQKKWLLGLLALMGLTAKAQFPTPYVLPNVDWIKYYSQRSGTSSAPNALDANSNVYLAGYTGISTVSDIIALKYDSTGVLKYNYSYNNGGYDNANAIKVDLAGNAYVAGVSAGTTTGLDYYIFKLSPTGAVLWSRRYDRGFNLTDEATDLCVDASGNVYVTGKSMNSSGKYDVVTLKLNSTNGTIAWTHVYNNVSSNKDDIGTGIVISSNGQIIYVTGNTINTTGNTDIVTYALKTSNGGTQWSPIVTNGTANSNDNSNGIIRSGQNIVICGELNNSGSGLDYCTIKYNGLTGAIIFNKTYDFGATTNRATALVKDSTGNIGVVGTAFNGSIIEYHTIFYDSVGTQYAVNKETTGLTSLAADPQITNDTIAHHWYVSGEKSRSTKDIFVYQITPAGNTSWRQYVDGQNSDVDAATGVSVNGIGVVYVAAQSKNSSASFDYTTIKFNQTPCYWPPDFNGETVNNSHLYLRNKGQLVQTNGTLATEVLYYTHNTNPALYVEKDAFNFVYSHTDTSQTTLDTLERMQVKFLASNVNASHHEYLPKFTNYNYFLGYAQSPAITDVQGHERIFVPNFYPYIDLHYFSGKGGIKYYFVVKPGADLKAVRMQINGATTTSINTTTGRLVIDGLFGDVEFNQPIAYTVNMMGAIVTLTGSAVWNSLGGTIYGIIPPVYTPTVPLIIQVSQNTTAAPASGTVANLDYSTYYGGSASDIFNDIATATNGDRYITGYTTAGVFPPFNSQNFYNGNLDAVLLKYTADDTLRYATFQGGSAQDVGNTVAVNSLNEVFVGGYTFSTDMSGFNVAGATNQFNNGGTSSTVKQDGFISKLTSTSGNPSSNSLVWRRYFGGSQADNILSIYIDNFDNMYFAGYSNSTDCPVINAFKATLGPTTTANPANTDAIFGKFNPSLTAQWITYYGGSATTSTGVAQTDWGYDIVVDNNGNVIGTGITDGINLVTTNTTGNSNTFFDNSCGCVGSTDGFLVRYNSGGTSVDFSSYFGGSNSDNISRLVHKSSTNEIYFSGDSNKGTGFPFVTKSGAFNSTYSLGQRTSFLGYMRGDLSKEWCTYYGRNQSGTKSYYTNGLSVDNSGLVYLSGYTTTDTLSFPSVTPPNVYVDNTRSLEDGFVAVFAPDKSLFHAHYFGGVSGNDRINNSAISLNSKLYVTGQTGSTNFPLAYTPTTAALIDSTYNGGGDGFISRFDLAAYQIVKLTEFDFDNSGVIVYPNPTSSAFTVSVDEAIKSKTMIKIYSIMGQLVFEKELTEQNLQINCENWTNGIYLVNLSNNDSSKTFKLVKQ